MNFKRTYLTFLTIMMFVSFIVLFGVNLFLKFNIKILILIIINAFFMNLFNLQLNDFRCDEKLSYYNMFKVMNAIIKILIIVVLFNYSATPEAYLIATALSFIILSGRYLIRNFGFRFNKSLFESTVKFGLPLIGTSIGYLLLSSFDRYMISFFRGDIEVAYYSFAYQISELSLININALLMVIFYPLILKFYDSKGREETEVLLSKLFNYHIIIVFPIALLLIIFSKDLTYVFFQKYIGAENYIILIVIGVFIYCTSFYTNKAFEVKKKTSELLVITLVTAIVNIILNYIYIPKYGAISAAITTIISYIIYIVLSIHRGKKYLKFNVDKMLIFKMLLITLILICITLVTNKYIIGYSFKKLFVKAVIIICIYLVMGFILKLKNNIKINV